jgi:post-segregation antitoxin (ccd killing protein)
MKKQREDRWKEEREGRSEENGRARNIDGKIDEMTKSKRK